MKHADGSFGTDRLLLRPFTKDDWAGLREIGNDMHASGGAVYDHAWPTSEDGAKAMAERLATRDTFFAACLKDGGRIVGLVAVNDINENGQADLGHMFHTAFRNKAYDTEAVRCVLDIAFADPKVKTVKADNAVDWPEQVAPLVDLGFKETGRGPASFAKDERGKPIEFTACTMEITREDWQARRQSGRS